MKKFLKTFKKSEIAVYAIAIMLVAAGYLNYTTMDKNTLETYSEDISNIQSGEKSENNNIDENNIEVSTKTNTEEKQTEDDEEKIGEAALVSNNEVEETKEENDYFTNSKLERDTTYASMISNYTAIVEKNNVSESEKKDAMEQITNINNIKNAIMICENLLSTKGFKQSVIFINDKSVNVVVKVDNGLTKEKVAQIQNIVSRELNVEINNIHISENK